MSRTLSALAVIQVALLAFLAVKVTDLERPRPMGSAEPDRVPPAASRVTAGRLVVQPEAVPTPEALEASLRKIVREEVAAVVQARAAPAAQDARQVETGSVAPRPDPQRLAVVSSQLDYFIGIGSISPSEMAVLQGGIAQLDEAGRRQMLGRLVRAINTGSLKGEL